MSIATYETFDLVSEDPAGRISTRRAVQSDGRAGPQFSRQVDERQVRRWVVTIHRASYVELRRLNDLWNRTRFGTLPMDYTDPEDGAVVVCFDEQELTWRQVTGHGADIQVTLVEWLG